MKKKSRVPHRYSLGRPTHCQIHTEPDYSDHSHYLGGQGKLGSKNEFQRRRLSRCVTIALSFLSFVLSSLSCSMRERTPSVVHQRVIDAPLRANEFSYQMRRCFGSFGSLESRVTCCSWKVKLKEIMQLWHNLLIGFFSEEYSCRRKI